MDTKSARDRARLACKMAAAAVLLAMTVVPGAARPLTAYDVAQGPSYDEGQYEDRQDAAPEEVQPGQRDAAPSEDGTDDEPDMTAPQPPSGCNFRDGRPLELLV